MKKKWVAMIGSGTLIASIAVAGAGLADSEGRPAWVGTIRIDKQSEAEFPSVSYYCIFYISR